MSHQVGSEDLREVFSQLGLITRGGPLIPILHKAFKAACVSDLTVLLEGETGTGKQVLAQAIQRLDPKRAAHPFVTVHCGAINESIAESEFFGHQRGAFSGATSSRKGLFQSAQMGTVFLDDVNDLSLPLQAKLLDVIQRKMIRPVGGDQETAIDVRIIAASNQPLKGLVLQNRFRADLYHRLDVVRLPLLPLRDRKQDLPALIVELARRHSDIYGPIVSVETDLISFLERQPLPGNIRELENGVQRMLFVKNRGSSLNLLDWLNAHSEEKHEWGAEPSERDPLDEAAGRMWQAISQGVRYSDALRQVERKVLETALSSGPTRREIAKRLSTSERTLYHKLKAHRIGTPSIT